MAENLDRDLDSLFALPLAEFTSARNALAKRLQQTKRSDDAEKVRAIPKPSISAWAVNQLYWNHRREFTRLLDAGKRLAQAQAAQLTGTRADIRGRIDARREAISALLQLADAILREAGHSATPDTLRRIETTLGVLSTSNPISDGPQPGRLTEDVAPLGFESLAAWMPADVSAVHRHKPVPGIAATRAKELEDAAALVTARENELHQAGEALVKARAAADEAMRRARALGIEAEKAEKVVHDAESALQQARAELDRLKSNRQ